MNFDELYKNQYANKKLKNYISFKQLRKIFKKYDIDREDMVVSLLENGDRLLGIGCGEGKLLLKAKDKYKNLYGIDIVPERLEIARDNFSKEKIGLF